jgi:hypothetical protein
MPYIGHVNLEIVKPWVCRDDRHVALSLLCIWHDNYHPIILEWLVKSSEGFKVMKDCVRRVAVALRCAIRLAVGEGGLDVDTKW